MFDLASRAQDEFANLVEDCRLKRVMRCIVTARKTFFEQHDAQVDLSDVPVFFFGEAEEQLDIARAQVALKALENDEFRLPYARFCIMHHVGASNAALLRNTKYPKHTSRFYCMIVEEEEDGSILLFSFMKHSDHDRWVKQTWQAVVTQGQDAAVQVSYEPVNAEAMEFIKHMDEATQQRVMVCLAAIWRLTNENGAATYAASGPPTAKINARRNKLALSEVPRVRIIEFDKSPTPAYPSVTKGSGTPKRAHFRRGTWRTLRTGRRTWVKPSAIHGGQPAPFYEVRD